MQKLLRIAHFIDAITEKIGHFTSWLVLVMVFVGVTNVILGEIGQRIQEKLTSNTLLEIQWHLFDIVFLLGAGYALKNNVHVRVDVLYKNWTSRQKALANFLGSVLFLIPFSAMIIYYSWQWTLNSWRIWEQPLNPGGLPPYWIKSMIVIAFGLLILQGISQSIKSWAVFRGYLTPQEAGEDV